jgi:hypothetical protein
MSKTTRAAALTKSPRAAAGITLSVERTLAFINN